MELQHLTTLHEPTPLGIDPGCTPYFGWQLRSETPGTRQIACRLQVCAPGGKVLWDTGRQETGRASFVPYAGPALCPRRLAGGLGAHPRAYVQRRKGFGTQPPATRFRRVFTLDTAPAAARCATRPTT